MNTPLVLFVYNRPENINKIISKLKDIKPKKIFVFADGPKNEKDKLNCEKTIKNLKKINWSTKIEIIKNKN